MPITEFATGTFTPSMIAAGQETIVDSFDIDPTAQGVWILRLHLYNLGVGDEFVVQTLATFTGYSAEEIDRRTFTGVQTPGAIDLGPVVSTPESPEVQWTAEQTLGVSPVDLLWALIRIY